MPPIGYKKQSNKKKIPKGYNCKIVSNKYCYGGKNDLKVSENIKID